MKTSIVQGLGAFVLVALAGCSSGGGPESSSSSHWVGCVTSDDCGGTNVCDRGYCVDASGAKVEVIDDSAAVHGTCNPHAAPPVPLELGADILGAGYAPPMGTQDSSGTHYVADRVASVDRMFVSKGDALERVRVLGSGSGGAPPDSFVFVTFESASGPKTFAVQTTGGVTELSLIDGGWRPGGEPPATSTPLQPVDLATVRGLAVEGWVNPMISEYYASVVSSGEMLIVLRPEVDWSYEDFRVFYGPLHALPERRVTSVTRARDGGSTHVVFELESGSADAFFPFQAPATLTVGGDVRDVTVLDVTAIDVPPPTYLCLLK